MIRLLCTIVLIQTNSLKCNNLNLDCFSFLGGFLHFLLFITWYADSFSFVYFSIFRNFSFLIPQRASFTFISSSHLIFLNSISILQSTPVCLHNNHYFSPYHVSNNYTFLSSYQRMRSTSSRQLWCLSNNLLKQFNNCYINIFLT